MCHFSLCFRDLQRFVFCKVIAKGLKPKEIGVSWTIASDSLFSWGAFIGLCRADPWNPLKFFLLPFSDSAASVCIEHSLQSSLGHESQIFRAILALGTT
jgi:hypothetical protein